MFEAFVSITTPQEAKQSLSQSQSQPAANEAVLVTGPHCLGEESDGHVRVESTTCESIKLSPFLAKPIRSLGPVTTAASFGAQDQDEDAVELQEGTQHRTLQLQPDGRNADPSREHGYKYAYTQDDLDDPAQLLDLDMSTVSTSLLGQQGHERTLHPIYILGKAYHPIHDYSAKRTDEATLLWFTYRCDFPEIAPYRITTDAGWGCMLRSAQMMLGQALRMHFKTRSWRPPPAVAARKVDPFVRSLLTWFADHPSRNECVFSLHNMVAAGLAKYDVLPGEWYGPGTAAYVMRDLVEMYEQQRKQHADADPIFRVYVAPQGTVYRDAVDDLMTKQAQEARSKQAAPQVKPEPLHPLEPLHIDHQQCNADLIWDTAVLILIPLRLGLKTFNNAEYTKGLAHMFSFPQSVGVLGGRPRGARWFYGASADGKLYGLDPHTIQMAPERRAVTTKDGKRTTVIAMTDDYVTSVHTTNPETMSLAKVDPSLALGFYCKNRADLDELCQSLLAWNLANPTLPELFTMADAVPDYAASSAMNDMMLSMTGDEEEDVGHVSDDEEYVLL
jgi:cysteine protease ATG4